MTINWLGTTALALVIGTGVVVAQSQPDASKREESPRAQAPSKDADRPAADERKDRAAQPEPKAGAKDRGEADRKQAQEPSRDTKQPTQQSQEQQKGRDTKQGEAPPDRKQAQEPRDTKQPTKQSEDQQKGRDTKQSAEPKQQPKDSQARDTKQPTDTKQQQGQQQQPQRRDRDQATQPSTTPSTQQQGARPSDTQTQQGRTTGQTPETRASSVNEQQRTEIVDRLRRDRGSSRENVNIRVNIGERLPARVRPRSLPPDIVRIAPQYRGYHYTVVEDEIVIVNPRTREVVEVFREPSSAARTTSRAGGERITITREQRETLRQSARRMTSAPASGSSSMADSSCLTLQPVPEELVRTNPEFGSYRFLAIGDQVVLVDPREQKIVEVIQD